MPVTTATIYHDTRRKKANGLYPVKLQVFHLYERRYYFIMDLSKEDFKASYRADKPKIQNLREAKTKITLLEAKAKKIIDELIPFTWDKFEQRFNRPTASIGNVFYYYDEIAKKLRSEDRIGTAVSYEFSKKSLVDFLESQGKKTEALNFETITTDFLNAYERWMLRQGKGLTTIGIYLRPLRAIFNAAIEAEEVSKEIYPFKKGKYQIPAGKNVKKALSTSDLKKLYEFKTEDELIIKARAFWFFSYLCNGINVRDICELKYKSIQDDRITYVRTKTRNTTKANQTTIVAAMTPEALAVILRYGNKKSSQEAYVFPVFSPTMNAQQKHRATQNFTKFINQHIKRLAKLVGVKEGISTYYARHTFSTISVRSGASVEFIQKSLGHQNIKTTMSYIGSLGDEEIKKNAENLMKW